MKDHPVPQHIASYQFRLVGSMTLKQFLELAGGILLGWLIISTGLNPILKWSLGIFFALFGIALAFMPIEDRPLEEWVFGFIKAVYGNTQFVWTQTKPTPDFLETQKQPVSTQLEQVDSGSKDDTLSQYLESLPDQGSDSPLDQAEGGYLEHVQSLFLTTQVPQEEVVVKKISKSKPKKPSGVKVRKLKPFKDAQSPPKRPVKDINVPGSKPVKVKRSTDSTQQPKQGSKSQDPKAPKPQTPPPPSTQATQKAPYDEGKNVVEANYSPQLPLPYKPKDPNRIVGMVFDAQHHILTNTLLEVKDEKGNPVRALKANKLGQFSIATPLKDGTYYIEVDHPDKEFDIIRFKAKGEPIPPIEIRSNN